MAKFVNLEAAYDQGTLTDWYISSVGSEPPVWTDEHIEELLNDFYVIPKDTPAADVAPVVHGRWLCVDTDIEQFFLCNRCKKKEYWESKYCPNCGAKMDEEANK